MVVLEEANEFFEIVFGWKIVTTVWPYCLKKKKKNRKSFGLIFNIEYIRQMHNKNVGSKYIIYEMYLKNTLVGN